MAHPSRIPCGAHKHRQLAPVTPPRASPAPPQRIAGKQIRHARSDAAADAARVRRLVLGERGLQLRRQPAHAREVGLQEVLRTRTVCAALRMQPHEDTGRRRLPRGVSPAEAHLQPPLEGVVRGQLERLADERAERRPRLLVEGVERLQRRRLPWQLPRPQRRRRPRPPRRRKGRPSRPARASTPRARPSSASGARRRRRGRRHPRRRR